MPSDSESELTESALPAARRPLVARQVVFGLWRVCFPPYLVRPGRRLPVQGLSEGSLGCLDRLPAWRVGTKRREFGPSKNSCPHLGTPH